MPVRYNNVPEVRPTKSNIYSICAYLFSPLADDAISITLAFVIVRWRGLIFNRAVVCRKSSHPHHNSCNNKIIATVENQNLETVQF